MDSSELILHLAGPAVQPFPDLAAVLRVVRNARAGLPGVRLELVVQGPGVAQLASEAREAEEASAPAVEDGVTITACRNSLRSEGIDAASLTAGVGVVPAAVAHLAQRQFNGAAYIRI
jgi:uncharacterized protein